MRIVASSLDLASSATVVRATARQASLQAWVGAPPAAGTAEAPQGAAAARPSAAVAVAQASASLTVASTAHADDDVGTAGERPAADDGATLRDQLDLAILLKTFRLEGALTRSAREIQDAYANPGPQEAADALASAQRSSQAPAAEATPARQGWGLRYDAVETTVATETTRFEARGQVTTADGRTIQIEAALSMARSEATTREVHLRAGDAALTDPLVLNLAGGAAALAGRATFDLDADGAAESTAGLASGSAWLAMDRNGDGAIGSGAELFGPTTGSGFGELAALDQDGNGWVDEGDAAFSSLRLWRPDGFLATLRGAGVGALSTRAVATPYALTAGGAVAGRIAETGLFLREDGSAGTVQHVDLVA